MGCYFLAHPSMSGVIGSDIPVWLRVTPLITVDIYRDINGTGVLCLVTTIWSDIIPIMNLSQLFTGEEVLDVWGNSSIKNSIRLADSTAQESPIFCLPDTFYIIAGTKSGRDMSGAVYDFFAPTACFGDITSTGGEREDTSFSHIKNMTRFLFRIPGNHQ